MNKLIIALTLTMASYSFADSNCQKVCDNDDVTVEQGFAATADLLIVRPLTTAGTVVGFGLFAVSSPFAAMADATDEVFEVLVKEPYRYTFERDLGDFSEK